MKFNKNLMEMVEAIALDLNKTIRDEPDYEALSKHYPIITLNSQADQIVLRNDRERFALGKSDKRVMKLCERLKTLDSFCESIYDSAINKLAGGLDTASMIFSEKAGVVFFERQPTMRATWIGKDKIDTHIIFIDSNSVYRTLTTQNIPNRENAFDTLIDALEYFGGKLKGE